MAITGFQPFSFGNAGQTAQDAIMARLAPQQKRNRVSRETQLANQGLVLGDEAYTNAQTDLGQQENDQLNQAALYGLNLDLTANNQGFNQDLANRQFDLSSTGQTFNQNLATQQETEAERRNREQEAIARQSLEPGKLRDVLLTSLIGGAATGTGPLGGLISGGGTNGTGNAGLLGDAIGGAKSLFNLGGGGTPSPEDIFPGGAPNNSMVPPPTAESIFPGGAPDNQMIPPGYTLPDYSIPEAPPSNTGDIAATAATTAAPIGTGLAAGGGTFLGLTAAQAIPIVGAAVAGTIALVKSQAHWEANTWVKNFQNPFDNGIRETLQGMDAGIQSGQMTKEDGMKAKMAVAEAVQGYLNKNREYAAKGSDYDKVTKQALETFNKAYGPNGQALFQMIDQKIAQLPDERQAQSAPAAQPQQAAAPAPAAPQYYGSGQRGLYGLS